MAHQTEAACLLETGALYNRRVLLQNPGRDPIFAGFKPGAFSLYYGDAPIYHFDRDGRWQRAFVDGIHFLKALDNTVQAIDRVREGPNLVLKRRTLSYVEASDLDARVRGAALELLETIARGRLAFLAPSSGALAPTDEELRGCLERIAAWDAAAWFAHRERYVATYGPLPFLPPDCTSPVVLQATLGHEGGVAFGGGRAFEHAVRTPAEFAQHTRDVAALLGARIEQCKAVFLGGADVLRQPIEQLAAYLESVACAFPLDVSTRPEPGAAHEDGPKLSGIHAFVDGFASDLPDREGWSRLSALGLSRVSLGVESGDRAVRELYGKTWAEDDLCAVVAALKASGIGVGVIALVGAGGVEHASRHLEATVALLSRPALGSGDLVSLLDANELLASNDANVPAHLRQGALTGPQWSAQLEALKEGLVHLRRERKVKVVPYSLEKQGFL
jgi:hypothetical protein